MPGELEQYELHHRTRIAIKPGITGMWQVSGRSDITDFEEVVELDRKYIENYLITSWKVEMLLLQQCTITRITQRNFKLF